MKKSRFTDSQIIEAIKRVESGLLVQELCRELSIGWQSPPASMRFGQWILCMISWSMAAVSEH